MSKKKKKVINKHFIGMVAVFILVIVTVLTFVSFLEDIIRHEKIVKSK